MKRTMKTAMALILLTSISLPALAEEIVVYRSREGWHNYPSDEQMRLRYIQDTNPEFFQNRTKMDSLLTEYNRLSEVYKSSENKKLIEPKLTEAREKYFEIKNRVDSVYNESRVVLRNSRLRAKYSALAEIAANDPNRSFMVSTNGSGYERISSVAELEKQLKIIHDPYNTETVLFQKPNAENPWGSFKNVVITASEKALLSRALNDYTLVTDYFKDGTSKEKFAKFTLIYGRENSFGIQSAADLEKFLSRLSTMRENIYHAKSIDEMTTAAEKLRASTKDHILGINEFESRVPRVSVAEKTQALKKEGHQVNLDENGKVKSILQKNGKLITGKANLKKALAALGLSTFALAASASEAASVETMPEVSAPRANFQAKAQFQQGAR